MVKVSTLYAYAFNEWTVLSILTSSIFNLSDMDKSKQQDLLKQAEEEVSKPDINDQSKYLIDQKIEVLRSINW